MCSAGKLWTGEALSTGHFWAAEELHTAPELGTCSVQGWAHQTVILAGLRQLIQAELVSRDQV